MANQLEGLERLRGSLGTQICTTWVSQNWVYHFDGPLNKDCSTLGSILGYPYVVNLPHWFPAEGGWVQLSPGNDPKPSTLNLKP